MKLNTTPPRTVRLKTWNDFATLARDPKNFSAKIVEVESSQEHAALLKALSDTNRPYAVCILKAQ
ncbi:MAG: hypothetical protein HQ485_14540 [Acidobacteria bacterium]|jgi:hypothetical protein|nr:hypothetical protein [Acidobacteriota bacterium]